MANNSVAYGFASLTQMMAQRASQVGVDIISRAILESSAEWTRATNELLSFIAERTTTAKETYLLPGSGTLQPLDEFGIPLPVRPSGSYDVAFPWFGGGTAYGLNRIAAVLETVAEINRNQLDAEQRDGDWLRRHVLAALLDKSSWTFVDPALGSLTIQPLANGDSVTYAQTGGSSATANHYVAQAAAIADATNPFPTIYSTLSAYPSNAGRDIISFVATAQVPDVQGLTAFVDVADPDIRPAQTAASLMSDGASIRAMGDRVLGKVDSQWIVEWKALPENYILSVVDGRPPLAMREFPDPRVQGLFNEIHSPDGARIERRYLRYAGFGVRNRISAMAYFVEAGDTTYDTPTAYDAPLAI